MTRHEAKLRKARRLLHEVFETGKLDGFEQGCVRAAVSSLDSALYDVHPPIGTKLSRSSVTKVKFTGKFCHACVHRKWAGHCEEFPTKHIDAHDGGDCCHFEEGGGLLLHEEIVEYKRVRGIA
ncbi:MAG: hypothetical protein JRG69_06290 [Deltaproteobacteria bacterium]|nr:hypothetical protein [Deltaproteobacteria bacterium]